MNRLNLFLLIAALTLVGCKHNPPDNQPVIDPDVLLDAASYELRSLGQDYQDADNFGLCTAGVILEAFADGSQGWALPIKNAIESGATSGELAEFTIDPQGCIGKPGTPSTPEEVEIVSDQIQDVLSAALPPVRMGLRLGSTIAASSGDTQACVVMTVIADLLYMGGAFALQVVLVVETPGSPFVVPAGSWNTEGCGVASDDPVEEPEPTEVKPKVGLDDIAPVNVETPVEIPEPVVPEADPTL